MQNISVALSDFPFKYTEAITKAVLESLNYPPTLENRTILIIVTAGREGTQELLSSRVESTVLVDLGVAPDVSCRDPNVAKKSTVFLLVVRTAQHLFYHELDSLSKGSLCWCTGPPVLPWFQL